MDGEVGGQYANFHLDSGSSGGIGVTPEFATQLRWASPPESVRVTKSVSNDATVFRGRLDGAVTFAGLRYDNAEIEYVEFYRTGNIGQQILKDLVLTLDQKNRRVALRRP